MITDAFIDEVLSRLAANLRVRRTLPDGGRLHIDRKLPFLCLYRQPAGQPDAGTSQLVWGEASFLIASGAKSGSASLSALVTRLAEAMSQQFGAFLVIEVWSAPDSDVADAASQDLAEPTELRPDFVIATRGPNLPQRTLQSFRGQLERITILKQTASVQVVEQADPRPRGFSRLLTSRDSRRMECHTIGLCVRPIYRNPATGEVYPEILRKLKRGLGRALKQTFFTFAKTHTTTRPEHFYSLGRRSMVKAVWEVDRRLAEISDSFDFLLQVTPVNAEGAWKEFRRSRFKTAPRFYYRPLAVDPTVLKRRLFGMRIEDIEDPTLGELFRQRQDELDRKITMLSDIGSRRFVLGSLQVYGVVQKSLLKLSNRLINELSSRSREDSREGVLTAEEFAKLAQQEIDHYRTGYPKFTSRAIVREDLYSGLLCSRGNLLIGHQTKVHRRRAEALLQHEVGTHLLTYFNGLAEPFQQLHSGLAGYDALQEGLAVLSEHLVGGLSIPRLRLLAARVLAAQALVDGASFMETFRMLDWDFDFSQRTAYTITMRTYRGGGLTKDAVYLRGLVEILDYIKKGGELEPLFVGKIAVDHIPLIRELRHRKVLNPPMLSPRYLEMPGVTDRLTALRNGLAVIDLVKGITK